MSLQELHFQFVILAFMMMATFVYSGYTITQKTFKNRIATISYWKFVWPSIISYTIFMGLRYGRLIDYNIYYKRYNDIFHDIDTDPVFSLIMKGFGTLGVEYPFFIAFTSFFFIFSFLLYLKNKQEILLLALPFFISECFMAENLIKWYFSFSICLISLYFFQKKKYITYLLIVLLAFFTHTGMMLVLIPFILLICVKRCIMPSKVCLALFVLASFIGNVNLLSILEPIMPYIGINEKLAAYAIQFDTIIKGQFGILGIAEQKGFLEIIRNILSFAFPIMLAPKMIELRKITYYELNAFYIGVIIEPIFTQVEILGRISGAFHFFQIVVSSYVYLYIFTRGIKLTPLYRQFSIVGFLCLLWYSIRYCLGIGRDAIEDLRFIWDVNF